MHTAQSQQKGLGFRCRVQVMSGMCVVFFVLFFLRVRIVWLSSQKEEQATPVRCDNSHQAVFSPPVRTRFVLLDDGKNPRLTAEACWHFSDYIRQLLDIYAATNNIKKKLCWCLKGSGPCTLMINQLKAHAVGFRISSPHVALRSGISFVDLFQLFFPEVLFHLSTSKLVVNKSLKVHKTPSVLITQAKWQDFFCYFERH